MLENSTLAAIAPYVDELVAIRRDIHAHPELGLEEHRTSALVAAKLAEWGIEHVVGVGVTGVVATIKGRLPGQRSIGLRADMDALAIVEQTGLAYASTSEGRMHACGHDGHTTMLLGAARYLAEHRDFSGTVQLIFQPAEEGRGGALAMLEDKLFERFPCDAIYGLHCMPGIEVGKFAINKGGFMAGGCIFHARFRGTGGHGGSSPHLSTDLSLVQAHFVLGLQQIVGRNISAFDTAVISVGHIGGGAIESCNVMPAEIVVGGTARYFNPPVKAVIERRITELAHGLAALHGATAELMFDWVAEPLVNQAEQTDVAAAAAGTVVGAAGVDAKAPPRTGGEDFAFLMKEKPGAFMFIGNGVNADGSFHGVHTPQFNFNDAIIPLGVAYWAGVVAQELALKA
jgi:hippurate hydrolase